MSHRPPPHALLLSIFLALLPLSFAAGQTLAVTNDIQTLASLSATAATVTGRAELRLTGTGDVLPGSTVNLATPDAWLIFTQFTPSNVRDTYLSRIRVNGAAAVLDVNVRIVQFGMGAVVIPHAPAFQPLEVFPDPFFRGTSRTLSQYTEYNAAALGTLSANIGSFKLKRGYMATLAASEDGVSNSRCYVAQDGDVEMGRLPAGLNNAIRFVRIFPWRWVSKKGIAGEWPTVNPHWYYNWNLNQNSSQSREYVAIKQQRYWPSLDQDWQARKITHVLGFNEPDNPIEADLSAATAVDLWPELLGTGLRTGTPAVTDGGLSWLYSFTDAADAAGRRVDYVAVHYYRSYWNNNDPAGIANQFYNFLKGIYDRTRRPIWITEWNNGANWTTDPDPTFAQQADAVEAMLNMLDTTPFVERYALYNKVEDVRRVVWDDGWPTDAGVIYRDKVSPVGHRQEQKDSGIGRTTRYRFDGTSSDDGGNGQNAIRVGTPSYTTGRYGQAILLDGANDYLQVPASVGDSTDFTFAAWVYWNGGGNWQRIFDLGDTSSEYLFLTTKAGSAAGTRFAITTSGGSGEQRLDAATFPTGAWTHVAVTISGNTGKLFINGALVDTNTAMTINPDSVGVKYNYLGHSRFAADPNFNGRLDDVRFLSSALTEAQVSAIASTAPPAFTANPIAGVGANIYQPYSGSISAAVSGGSGALTFTKMDGPAWLRVSTAGALSGTPGSADAGVNRFMVRVADAAGGAHMTELTIDVQSESAVPVTVTSTLTGSASDAEENAAGDVTLTSTDLELTEDPAEPGQQTVGLRFAVQVPPGALVQEARIQFTADEDQSEATSLTIATEATDAAAAFTTAARGLSTRAVNPVTIPWQPEPWIAGSAGAEQQTPNLAGIVQSVVTRPGWQMGNAMTFLITGTGHRTADAVDKSGGAPARLTVTYLTPSPRFTVTSTIGASENDAEESAAGVVNLTSTDLELVADGTLGNQTIGLRFAPLAIPRDALIAGAAIQFIADEAQNGATALTIRAQAADNAPLFTTAASSLSSRARTAAGVAWAPAAWATVDERGPLQLTPDLSPVVQEVISRSGWTSSSALAFLITGTGHRTAGAFDDSPSQPASLTVNYYTEIPLFTYDRWAVDYPELTGGPGDDDDSDGAVNLLEYALGSNPLAPGGPPPQQLAPAGNLLHFTWQQASTALDVVCAAEWSDDLSGPWSTAGVSTQIIADDGSLRTLRATLPSGANRRFLRLNVHRP